ncbi:serine carboxypeptidase-like 20 isoform X2 [Amaranthus tricolor]|uniref:serine carboxypeptidase-like 20 isoform X2 n=1 Tax=Amaranthus tricolor TaxID=29722 RepID=UPI00258E49F6|nr:serine carboxypeptidase-like 20 isoform X2 [Amaranthus tricolor]
MAKAYNFTPNLIKIQLILIIVLFLCFTVSKSAPQNSLVTQLPGFSGTFPSKHYSGYVTIDESHRKKLYYYFVESERNPSQDPVVLWLNGGPGCSSLDGFVYEHGPFNFEAAKTKEGLPKLHLNSYSWSKVSNIIYLDSPSGVGYSYSHNTTDYDTGDIKTASDTHTFLLKWFEVYKEFATNPFFIAGESYAGIYVPTLASEIVKGLDTGVKPVINLKGYLVGNGVTDDKFDGNALIPFAHGMGLISDELYQEIVAQCAGNYYDVTSDGCDLLLSKVNQNDEVATAWLNDKAVRKALHADDENVAGPWELCTGRIAYNHDAGSMIKYHKNLTARGYRALIYSGDHDMCVPYTGSEAWTKSVGYKVVDEWRPWMCNDQVAGFTQGYEKNLTFLTIKGSGHTVPEYKPREALYFYSRFLSGQSV